MALKDQSRAATNRQPIHDPLPEWAEVACGYWPFLRREWMRGADDIDRFQRECRAEFRDVPSDDALLVAVRWLAGPEGRQVKAPTMLQVFRAVYILRKQDRAEHGGNEVRWNDRDRRKTIMLTVGRLQEMIRRADPGGRWDIIRDVLEKDDHHPIKHELEAFADTLDGGVDKYVPKPGAFSGPRAAVGQAFDARAAAPAPPVTGAGYMPGRVSDEEGGWL